VRAPIALLRIPTCDLLLSSITDGEMVAWYENLPRSAPPPILALLPVLCPLAVLPTIMRRAAVRYAPLHALRRCGIGRSRTSATRETRDINPS
jgi:hypothetical protein